MFFKNIPSNQIAQEHIEKFLVRSAIINHPQLWNDYKEFIYPLIPGEEDQSIPLKNLLENFFNINTKEESLFREFVFELRQVQDKYEEQPFSQETAELHRKEALDVAMKFCHLAKEQNISRNIFPQLETITENIGLRKVVEQYSRYGGYGTV